MAADAHSAGPKVGENVLLAAYNAVTARRVSYDTMMWQVPALSITAQAFLLAIALGLDSTRVTRVAAAMLGLILAVLSTQLMTKYRLLELIDNRLAWQIEQQLGLDRSLETLPHAHVMERARLLPGPRPWWVRLSSYRLWLAGLILFTVADFVAAVAAATDVRLFG